MTHDEDCLGGICDCDNPIPLSRPVITHDELLAKLSSTNRRYAGSQDNAALRAVVELHRPDEFNHCGVCNQYLCETIQAIEKELG